VRRSPAAERLAAFGQWCQPRAGVQLVERADPATGALVSARIIMGER
jgi:N-methylhydantoinase B